MVLRAASILMRHAHHHRAHTPIFPHLRYAIPISLTITTLATLTVIPPLHCSPTYHGVPVAATFLMHQALPIFDRHFPGLEMSAVFAMGPPEFSYVESGLSIWPTGAEIELPIYERLTQEEEERLGSSGIRKRAVGRLVLKGSCTYGCAAVKLTEMRVLKLNGEVQWEKKLA